MDKANRVYANGEQRKSIKRAANVEDIVPRKYVKTSQVREMFGLSNTLFESLVYINSHDRGSVPTAVVNMYYLMEMVRACAEMH